VKLPSPVADALATKVLSRATAEGVLPAAGLPDWERYASFRARVRDAFDVPQTSVTPLMARVLYGIAALARPRRILGIGTYAGNTLVWLAGAGFGADPLYHGELAVGVDVDAEATGLAARNFRAIGGDLRVQLRCEDGHDTPRVLGLAWDLVFLDADDPGVRKRIYLSLLEAIYPWLAPGGLVLAHDICVPMFRDDLALYQAAVRDRARFARSLSLEIDDCGLEVSVKVTTPPAGDTARADGHNGDWRTLNEFVK
jgi:predicted O-methyltransferase YrrM